MSLFLKASLILYQLKWGTIIHFSKEVNGIQLVSTIWVWSRAELKGFYLYQNNQSIHQQSALLLFCGHCYQCSLPPLWSDSRGAVTHACSEGVVLETFHCLYLVLQIMTIREIKAKYGKYMLRICKMSLKEPVSVLMGSDNIFPLSEVEL